MTNPNYSIVIATKNEEESIAKVICSVPRGIIKKSELIVVDSSTDLTPIIAKNLGAKVILEKKRGKGRAMKTGVQDSKGNILIFMDGDGTDPPEYIPKLLEKLKTKDLVLGCRALKSFESEDPVMRKIFKLYGLFLRPLFRLVNFNVADPLAGFRAIRKKDWDKLNLQSNDFTIETEMNIKAAKLNFKIAEIAIPHLKRGGGLLNSKLVTNPRMWFKIISTVMRNVKDEKIRRRIINLKSRYKILMR